MAVLPKPKFIVYISRYKNCFGTRPNHPNKPRIDQKEHKRSQIGPISKQQDMTLLPKQPLTVFMNFQRYIFNLIMTQKTVEQDQEKIKLNRTLAEVK